VPPRRAGFIRLGRAPIRGDVNRLALRPRDRARMTLPFALVALLPLALAPFPPDGDLLLTAVYAY
jgi:hypothetical protein